MTVPPPIEFARWETPIENDNLQLIDITYGGGDFWSELHQERLRYEIPASERVPLAGFHATFLSFTQSALFRVSLRDVSAFRVLDEHGLTELWQASQDQEHKTCSTVRVRNHSWNRESGLSFIMAGAEFSFLIITDWDCLEIVSAAQPEVTSVRLVPPAPIGEVASYH